MNLKKAVDIIKRFEGILDGDPSTVNLEPYLCPAEYWTIGWGHIVRDITGKTFKGKETKKEAYRIYPYGITMKEAEVLLNNDIKMVAAFIETKVTVPLNDNQLAALVSFVFNVGHGNFNRSTLLRKLNAGDYASVTAELKKWDKTGGKQLRGLTRRREIEGELWETPIKT